MWSGFRTAARSAGLSFAAVAVFAAAAGQAAAQSPICADLQSQYLAAFGATQRTVGVGQRLVDMDKISRELANAQMAARQGNCNRFLFFGPRPSPQCPAIMATMNRLQQQLAQMRGSRSLFAVTPEQDRDRLRGWLLQNGCNIPQPGGGQRTICVRTCDGYFFPISYSTSRQQVSRDAAVCQSMYAADGQAELFSHTTNRDIADAQSLSGERYGNQPYAFLFRQAFFGACASQLKDGIAALGARYWSARPRPDAAPQAASVARVTVPMPNMRPVVRQEDPETIANRRGQLAVEPYVPEAERMMVAVGGSGIRLVGDPYYAELFDPTKPYVEPPAHRPPLGFDLIGSAMAAMPIDREDDGDRAPVSEIR